MWETPRVPVIWREDVGLFSSIFAATKFIKDSFESLELDLPVSIIPHEVHVQEDQRFTMKQLGLPDDRRVHLYSFSYASHISRKNPNAFLVLKKYFLTEQDYKSDLFVLAASDLPRTNCEMNLHKKFLAEVDSNFIYLSGGRTREEHQSLIANSNSFISLHRSEGIGLQLVESIILGTPVVTHTFSGPSDFIRANENGVYPHVIRKINEGEYPFSAGQEWADYSTSEVHNSLTSILKSGTVDKSQRNRVMNHFSLTRTAELIYDLIENQSLI
jgi:glycosyltransferase involved in cell wall biosynthesis